MRAVWVSTVRHGRGGVPTFVDTLARTRLWADWSVVHVTTHEEGSAMHRVAAAARGLTRLGRIVSGTDRPDIAHVHTASGASFLRKAAACALCRAFGVPVVLHVHNGRFDAFTRSAPSPVRRLVVSTLTRAAAVVAVSEPLAAALRAIAPGASVTTVANPVGAVAPRRRNAGRPRQVVFAGRLGAAKGTYVLVEAWARLAPSARDGARLVLLGDGDVAGVRALAERLGVGPTCVVRGWVPHGDAIAEIAASDVLALPSRVEGQPLAVLEAMAAGLCVVATPVGGVPDLVEHGRTGLLVEPDDPDALAGALDTVLTDPALADRLGAAARERTRRTHDVDAVVDRIEELYRRVLAGRPAREEAR